MRIEHLAIWANDLESLKDFYTKYFNLTSSDKYINPKTKFNSYFLSFGNEKTRIELMYIPDLENSESRGYLQGLAHFAISVGSKENVDIFSERIKKDGFFMVSKPRVTGDGYYESVILDPEGNYVEITE